MHKQMKYTDILQDTIFPSFIRSCKIGTDTNKIKEEVYHIRDNHTSNSYSNRGGYQSPSFGNEKDYEQYESLQCLVRNVRDFANDTLREYLGMRKEVGYFTFWTNINQQYDCNVLHNHPNTDMVGVYYPLLPDDSGSLVLVRTDGSSHTNLGLQQKMIINGEEGRLYLFPGDLWHWVEPNRSDKDRISVSFNFEVRDL